MEHGETIRRRIGDAVFPGCSAIHLIHIKE